MRKASRNTSHKVAIAVEISRSPEVARTVLSTTGKMHILHGDVTAAALATQNIVVLGLLERRARNISHDDIADLDAVGRMTGRPAVEVVLLDVDAVDGRIFNADVFKQDVCNVARRV